MTFVFSYHPTQAGCYTRSIFMQSLTCLKSEFFFSTNCYTKVKEHSLPYYLPIAEGRIVVLSEMQTALSSFWTQLAISISNDNEHYYVTSPLNGLSIYDANQWVTNIFVNIFLGTHLFVSPKCCINVFFQNIK